MRARLRARPSSSAPASASASCAPPLPAACRPARPALPGPPPTELCRYHFRREKRARRRTLALCAGERKCSEAEAADRNGRCAGMGRLCRRARGTRGSSVLGSSWDGVCPLSTHPPGVRGGSTPNPVSLRPHIPSRRPRNQDVGTDTVVHGRVPESPGHSKHCPGSLPVPRPSQSPRTTQ